MARAQAPTAARVPTLALLLTAWSQLHASVCPAASLLARGIKSEFLLFVEGTTPAQGVSLLCICEMLGSTQGVEGGTRRVQQGLSSALQGHSACSGHPGRKGGARLVA